MVEAPGVESCATRYNLPNLYYKKLIKIELPTVYRLTIFLFNA